MSAEDGAAADHQDEFLWKAHSYVADFIRFADTKAVVVIAWDSAMISAMFGYKAHHLLWPSRLTTTNVSWPATIAAICTALGLLLFVTAFVAAIAAIIPRRRSRRTTGFIFWDDIIKFGSADGYLTALEAANAKRHIADHLFTISEVCSEKFTRLVWAIRLSFLGSIAVGIVALIWS